MEQSYNFITKKTAYRLIYDRVQQKQIKAPIEMRSTTVAKLHNNFCVVHDVEDPDML